MNASPKKDDYMRGYGEGFADCLAETAPQGEAERRLTEAKANEIYSSQLMRRFRDTLSNVRDGLEDEGDRIYFGSTNDADQLRAIIEEIEELEWDRITASSQKKPDLWGRIRDLNVEVRALKAALTEIRDRHIPDCPAHFAGSEQDWVERQYIALRRVARDALDAKAVQS